MVEGIVDILLALALDYERVEASLSERTLQKGVLRLQAGYLKATGAG